ncbi:MAG TPA: PAS domain-containing protein [Desulfuromonadales bacterium]|nr:PAS domain-containing protein [Desulfuromonadales bacterium]
MKDFSKIANAMGCGLLIFDERMKIEHANEQAVKIFRLPPENLIGQPLASIERMFADPSGRKSPLKHCVEKHDRLANQELELLRPEGGVVISLNACPLFDLKGNAEGLVIDFIQRPRREERLHHFIGAMDEVVFEFDTEGRYLNVWSGNESLLKMPPQELLGKRVEDVVPRELAETLKSAFQRVRRTGQPETIEYPLKVLDGRRWFLGRVAKVVAQEGGEPTFSFLARDITERKKLEERLQESERKFHGIFDKSFQFFGLLSPSGMLMEINKTACDFLGVEESEVLGKPFWETPWWGHSLAQQKKLRQMIRDAAQGECVRFETVHPDSEGKEHYFDVSLKPVFDQNGKVEMLIPEGRDVTERKRAEEELRFAHRQLQDIVEFLPDATFVVDREKKIIAWNQAIEEMTGVHKEEVLGKGKNIYAQALHGEPRPTLIDLIDRPLAELRKHYEIVEQKGNITYVEQFLPTIYGGKGAQVWATASRLCDPQGNLMAVIESIRDITERKKAKEELQEANRELDAFVHTISHDLRTPLTAIFGYAQLVKERYHEVLEKQGLEMLEEIEKSSCRMENLLADLLALAKVGKIRKPAEPIDTNSVVRNVLANLAELISDKGVEVDIVETLPALQLPETLLTQIFDNLIGNAVRYAGKIGSPIKIGGERKGEQVRLYVLDHGLGIPPEEKKRIFDLFCRGSTGKTLQGTGIGLATVQKIARHYGGEAWVEDTPGGGATFWVELMDEP